MRKLATVSLCAIALSTALPILAQDAVSVSANAEDAAIAPLPAEWIWDPRVDAQAVNRFTWFRRTVTLDDPPDRATLFFAADANARTWLN